MTNQLLRFHDRRVLGAALFVHDEVDHVDVLAVAFAVGAKAVDRGVVLLHRGGLIVVERAAKHAVAVDGQAVVGKDGLD